jgi:hypothetical protein
MTQSIQSTVVVLGRLVVVGVCFCAGDANTITADIAVNAIDNDNDGTILRRWMLNDTH